ncbi:MAG TPA: beta-propeller domain-containing protein [Anaeromyxobacteraceae bacterium]
MRRPETLFALFLAALAAQGCGTHRGSDAPHPPGEESFESQPPNGAARGGVAVGTAAPAGAPGAAPASGASAGRTIEEADIYKRVGSTLFVLNAFRGLQVVDLADLSAPRLLARVPVVGTPVDLYARGTTAFVVVSDAFSYVEVDGEAQPRRSSRLFAIDVADPASPRLVADLPVDGEVEQTRLVGDILYVVSRNSWWYAWPGAVSAGTVAVQGAAVAAPGVGVSPGSGPDRVTVTSFDVSDPASPRAAAALELPAGGWETHANVTPERITLSFAGWAPDASGVWSSTTRFRVVDISDPSGALAAGAEFAIAGMVRDRWGMDFDGAAGIFRAVAASEVWNGGATLEVFSSPAPGAAKPLARLPIAVAETLTAARFDGARVYIVTARAVDPLWAVDASDPAHPQLAGSLAMPGQLDFIEPRGDRLLALGHTSEAGQPFQLAVSLIDVTQLATPKLLSRAMFGASFGWIGAQVDDLRKAFIVLDPPPADIGLVLVPVQGFDQTTWRFAGGTQLLDLSRDALTLRGFLAHPGAVTRSFPADASGTHLIALSDSALQTIDAADRDAPAELARLDLARSVTTLALVRGKAVELAGDWYRGAMELAITDALDPDAAAPLARVDVAAPSARMFQDGDVTWLMARDWASGAAWLQAVDLSDPLHPALRGRLDLAAGQGGGFYPLWWGYGDEAVLVGHALAVHDARWFCPGVCATAGGAVPADEVRVYDLSDPDHPKLASSVALPDGAWSWGLEASGRYAWITHFEVAPEATLGRYYVDRIDLANPSRPVLLAKINVPGIFFAASDDGRRIFTLETWWTDSATTTWVNGLTLTADGTARLDGSAKLAGYPDGAAARAGTAWVATQEWTSDGSVSTLHAVDLGLMAVTSRQRVQGSWAWLRKAEGGKLFLQASWQDQGILVYDLADPRHPTFERFFRTEAWVWDVVVGGGWAYLPSGAYGVPMVKLAAP